MSLRVKIGGVLLVAVALAVWSAAAFAGDTSGTDGGNTATVGVDTSSSSAGASTATAPDTSGDGSGPSCSYTPVELAASAGFDLNPGGPTPGNWYIVTCPGSGENPEWIPTGPTDTASATGTNGRPMAAAAKAAASIVLPPPTITVNPAAFSVANLATWLAIDPAVWRVYEATARVGGVTATAVATPETVWWTMGDGGVVDCAGPGTQFNPALAADLQTPSCSYTYRRSSAGEPSANGDPNDGAFPVTATVTWRVTWTAVGAPGGGTLPSLQTASTTAIRVEQVESVGVFQ